MVVYVIIIYGSVAEWLKAHDSKSCGQKCLGGSNPLASAISALQLGVRLLKSEVQKYPYNMGDF